MRQELRLGNIPSLTWNRLDLNRGKVLEAPELNTQVDTRFEVLPAGISKQELTYEAAQDWLAQNAPAEEAESAIAGKQPIYHPQAFATGLGQDFDAYFQASGEKVELFEVADDTKVEEAITWSIDYQNGNQALTGQIFHVGKNSSLTVIMSYRSEEAAAGTAGISTKVVLEEGAHLTLVKAQLLGNGFTHFDDLGVSALENASLKLVQMELGGGKVYAGMQTELIGKHAALEAKVGYIAREDHYVDLNYNVVQRGKKTTSEMTFDGVMDGKAEKRLSDTIDFRKGSKGSVGHEPEIVLLLGDDIVNKSLPVFLSEEEDMEGTHGATIGRLDDDMLFYMASRGIDEAAAEQIMVRARLAAVAREIEDENLRHEVNAYVEEAFKA